MSRQLYPTWLAQRLPDLPATTEHLILREEP
jgi:hypothetical protein